MGTQWYCRIDHTDCGPFSTDDIAKMAKDGRLQPADFIRRNTDPAWVPAATLHGLSFGPRMASQAVNSAVSPPPIPAPPPPSPHHPALQLIPPIAPARWQPMPAWMWIIAGLCGCACLGLLIFIPIVVGLITIGSRGDNSGNAAAVPNPRIQIVAKDGTADLQAIMSELSPEQLATLGIVVLTTGADFYAARVRITNTGNVPINVYPQNLVIRLGTESTGVTTMNDARFLQPALLQPGYYVEGLVVYRASLTAGASLRLGAGNISYSDHTIDVTY